MEWEKMVTEDEDSWQLWKKQMLPWSFLGNRMNEKLLLLFVMETVKLL